MPRLMTRLLLLLGLLAWAGSAPVIAQDGEPDSYVLLIGVGNYSANPVFPSLAYTRADLDAMREIVPKLAGFQQPHITELFDQDAIKPKILAALAELAAALAAHPERSGLVYFSGHGMFLPDVEPLDEDDGTDEAFVTADLPVGPRQVTPAIAQQYLLLDDEVQDYLAHLPDCRRFLFIADACHSGGLAKELGDDPTMVKSLDAALDFAPDPTTADKGLVVSASELLSVPNREAVVILAAQDGQEALISSRHGHSVLTYALYLALYADAGGCDTDQSGTITLGELETYLASEVDLLVQAEYRGKGQQVQIASGLGADAGSTRDQVIALSSDTRAEARVVKESYWTAPTMQSVAQHLAQACGELGVELPLATATARFTTPVHSGTAVGWTLTLTAPAALVAYSFDGKGDITRIPLPDSESFSWSNAGPGTVYLPGGGLESVWPARFDRRGLEFVALLLLPPGTTVEQYPSLARALNPSACKAAADQARSADPPAAAATAVENALSFPGLLILPYEVEL